jgi:amidase
LVEYPLVLGPTWCQPQFEHGYDIADPPAILNLMRFVVLANVLGLPAACVPTGNAASGLPLGVQVIGDRFHEEMCLDAAEAIEQRLGTITPIDPAA